MIARRIRSFLVLLLLLLLLLLIYQSCAGPPEKIPAPTPPPTAIERATDPTPPPPTPLPDPWRGDYDAIPVAACPPEPDGLSAAEIDQFYDKISADMGSPVWGDDVQEGEFWVRRGVYTNAAGGFYQIEALAPGDDRGRLALSDYTSGLRVCLHHTFVASEAAGVEMMGSRRSDPPTYPPTSEDLIIFIDFMGAMSAGGMLRAAPEMQKQWQAAVDFLPVLVMQYPPQEWQAALQLPLIAGEQPYVVDFIIDPSINDGVSHQYPERQRKQVSAKVSVKGSQGGGSVAAGLCRNNSAPISSGTVTHGGSPEQITLSHSSGEVSTYDLGVRGLQNGSRYRVSGRWRFAFGAAEPTGSTAACNP